MSNLIRPEGQEVQLVPTVKWQNWKFPIRVLEEKVIPQADPKALIAATLVQLNDKDNLLWAGLMALAKDIYSRNPGGSTEFLDFVRAMGLVLRDGAGTVINVEEEITGVLKKN